MKQLLLKNILVVKIHNYRVNQLNEQIGRLSDAQLFTLFVWTHAEWRRAQRQPFSLPVNGAQFAVYHEERWT